jgi:hypothetical protein
MTALDADIAAIEAEAAPAVLRIRAWLRERVNLYLSAPDIPALVKLKTQKEPVAPTIGQWLEPAQVPDVRIKSRTVPSVAPKHGPSDKEIELAHAILQRMVAGETSQQIAVSLDISRRSVYQKLLRAGLSFPPHKCLDCGRECARAQRCGKCYQPFKRAQMRAKWAEKPKGGQVDEQRDGSGVD